MTVRAQLLRLLENEDLNFLLTNRIPRRLATQFVGWLSQIEQPAVRDVSIALWRLFSDVDLKDAKKTRFTSMHDCFTRELKAGSRPIDLRPEILTSPCDAIVGACGNIADTTLYQAKGFPYTLQDLLCDPELVETYRNGRYVTLRLTSGMYHRFHAPHDCTVEKVIYVSGDTWNVNPIALKRVETTVLQERARGFTNQNWQRLATMSPSSLLPRSLWLVFVCISSTYYSILSTAAQMFSIVMPLSRRVTSLAGSSTARRPSCSRRSTLHYVRMCVRE